MYQLFRIDDGVGSPLNDTQVLSGVFRPDTELVMKVVGDHLTVEAHNDTNAETLFLEGTITANDFGGAGVAWYGTVPRGNSNVYSRIEITYPGVVPETCVVPPIHATSPASPMGAGCGCAIEGPPGSRDLLLGGALLLGALVACRRSGRQPAGRPSAQSSTNDMQ